MVTDKTRRSEFIEQNLGLVHSCAEIRRAAR